MAPWEVVTTGYLDAWMPMAIKGGKVQLTSQIQCRCQYGQTQQKSCTTSTLTVRNGEAVTDYFSYDRPIEKQMGLPGGLPVIRQRRHRRYRFRPRLTRAELEEEGQYSRQIPRLHTDLRHKIEIEDGSIGFPDSEFLGIGGPKVNFFILEDDPSPSSSG